MEAFKSRRTFLYYLYIIRSWSFYFIFLSLFGMKNQVACISHKKNFFVTVIINKEDILFGTSTSTCLLCFSFNWEKLFYWYRTGILVHVWTNTLAFNKWLSENEVGHKAKKYMCIQIMLIER